ncbi:hypothetical protein VNI00_017078 [Paramarasmius palmivorus]|uniref:3'-5' exonuclease domain-containing protein n=1 Tax=Paramarasmius palmivorus TaxID=297713 RepID=A0AAW0B719_9AGAR
MPDAENIDVLTQDLSSLNLRLASTSEPQVPPLLDDVIFCDDAETLREAIVELDTSGTLIIDCEGRDLGSLGGALSLISVRITEPILRTYVFDVIRLGSSLVPLWSLLSSPGKRKVVFDGRQDHCAMWYGYGVILPNTIDLQLADIRSRETRGEGEAKQMQRLMRFFSPKSVNNPRQRHRYKELHLLQGLGGALIEHKVTAPAKGNVDHDSWMSRPLSDEQLFYAANDVYLIGSLLAHFEASNFIDDELFSQSARYITIWHDFQPDREDTFRSNPFLPLEILSYEVGTPRKQCAGCKRNLSSSSFPDNAWYDSGFRPIFCYVCTIIPVWLRRKKFFEDLKEKKKAEKAEKERLQREGVVEPGVVTM